MISDDMHVTDNDRLRGKLKGVPIDTNRLSGLIAIARRLSYLNVSSSIHQFTATR
jgi:hypothetical protein